MYPYVIYPMGGFGVGNVVQCGNTAQSVEESNASCGETRRLC